MSNLFQFICVWRLMRTKGEKIIRSSTLLMSSLYAYNTHTHLCKNMLCICSISIPSHKFYRICNSMESYFHERDINLFFRSVTLFRSTKSLRLRCVVSRIRNIIHYITLSTTTSVQPNAYQLQEEIKWHMAWRYVTGTITSNIILRPLMCLHSRLPLHLLHIQLKETERNM